MLYPASVLPDKRDALQYAWPWTTVRPPAQVANTLKQSDLDYSQASLDSPVSLSGTLSLKELIEKLARSTGLTLCPSPGSDQAPLYISAKEVRAGSLLKAISLATTGTWRRVGESYVFVFDRAGIGQIDLMARELAKQSNNYGSDVCDGFRSFVQRKGLLMSLPSSQWTLFNPTMEEINEVSKSGDRYYYENPPWSMLSEDHQSLVDGLLKLPKWVPQSSDRRFVHLRMRMRIAFEFSGMPPLLLSEQSLEPDFTDLIPYRRGSMDEGLLSSVNASQSVRLPLQPPVRGCIWKPVAGEDPAKVIATLKRHRFNVLYLKILADGYAAFPTKQFPQIDGLSQNYMQQIISSAHEESIKVFGFISVLRWSDGKPGHWISRRTDVLDYDLLGRTQVQCWSSFGRALDQELIYGEQMSGDAVTPISQDVKNRLTNLLGDLVAYDLDGLVLDNTSMHNFLAIGQMGCSAGMRTAFWEQHHIDSFDVPPTGGVHANLGESPLKPLVLAAYSYDQQWEKFYRDRCDDLLAALLATWSQANKDKPVWLVDTLGSNSRSVHDWQRFKQTVAGLLVPIISTGTAKAGSPGTAFKTVPLLRASEWTGSLVFARLLAKAQGQELRDEKERIHYNLIPATEGIAIDLSCAGRKKSDFLRILLDDSSQD